MLLATGSSQGFAVDDQLSIVQKLLTRLKEARFVAAPLVSFPTNEEGRARTSSSS